LKGEGGRRKGPPKYATVWSRQNVSDCSQKQYGEPEERGLREEMKKAADGPAGNVWRRHANEK